MIWVIDKFTKLPHHFTICGIVEQQRRDPTTSSGKRAGSPRNLSCLRRYVKTPTLGGIGVLRRGTKVTMGNHPERSQHRGLQSNRARRRITQSAPRSRERASGFAPVMRISKQQIRIIFELHARNAPRAHTAQNIRKLENGIAIPGTFGPDV